MNLEYLAYPWREDDEKVLQAMLDSVKNLMHKIDILELKIERLEAQVPNEKPQYQTWTSGSTSGTTGTAGQIVPNVAQTSGAYILPVKGAKK
jgi:hypothetical protein